MNNYIIIYKSYSEDTNDSHKRYWETKSLFCECPGEFTRDHFDRAATQIKSMYSPGTQNTEKFAKWGEWLSKQRESDDQFDYMHYFKYKFSHITHVRKIPN